MKHDLVLFDFDGTLADSLPWFARAMQRLSEQFGFKRLSQEEMDAYRNSSVSEIMSAFKIPPWKLARIAMALRRMMAEEVEQISLFPGIEPFLVRLTKGGIRVGIVSSNSQDNVQRVLGERNTQLFQCFECGVALLGKAAKLRRAARAAGIPVDRTLYIGDELRDLDAAKKARMPFGAVTWGCSNASAFQTRQADAVFGSIEEMESYLLTA